MTVSVVIPHYGPEELLRACLAALWAYTQPEMEVVVVDNGTGHEMDADVVVRNPDNAGFAAACNQGAAVAGGDHIVFLNNDTEVQPGWLEPLVTQLETGAGAVGSLLLYPDGKIQHAGVDIFRDTNGVLVAENRRSRHPRGKVDAVTGACLAIRRDVFFELGGFDEGYLNGYEDVSLCLSLRRAGYRVVFEPASVVTHHESASGPERWVAVRRNVRRLQEQWNGVAAR